MSKKLLISSLAVLAIAVIAVIYIIIRQFQSQSEKIAFLEKQIRSNPTSLGATPVDTSVVSSLISYYASVAEVGGYIIGETVSDPVGNKLDVDGLMSVYINRADDYMQVWCGKGYKAVNGSSFTNNPVSKSPAPLQGYGIQIPDVSVTSMLSVTCQKN